MSRFSVATGLAVLASLLLTVTVVYKYWPLLGIVYYWSMYAILLMLRRD